jgi:uncharacterized membrane protein YeaQ/YmgE (transglycosylase-associated protein family)
MKGLMWLNITLGGLVGGWIGSLLDHGNGLGLWSLLFGTVGSLVAIWLTIRLSD